MRKKTKSVSLVTTSDENNIQADETVASGRFHSTFTRKREACLTSGGVLIRGWAFKVSGWSTRGKAPREEGASRRFFMSGLEALTP